MHYVSGKKKTIKHSRGVVAYFLSHLNPNLSQWKEGGHNSYLWLRIHKGATLDLFVCMVYATPVGSKHESKSLFQNLPVDIVKVQTIRGIVLLGGNFNARTTMLLNTMTLMTFVNYYKPLKLIETKQPSIMVK
jgi:hypothetical protein